MVPKAALDDWQCCLWPIRGPAMAALAAVPRSMTPQDLTASVVLPPGTALESVRVAGSADD